MISALLAALILASPCPARSSDSPLVGTWTRDGAAYAEFRADGTGRVDGQAVAWSSDGRAVTLVNQNGESERVPFRLERGALKVAIDGRPATLRRGTGKASRAGKDGLSALLLSSPWCNFSYNKISGASHEERVVFRSDGTWSSGARGESYSSGAYGSVAGQSGSASSGRWQSRGGRLLMSKGAAPVEDTGLSVARNSNGYPILTTGGKEYSQCR